MADSFEKLKQAGGKLAGAAGRSAAKLADKGKTELDRIALNRRLARAERQLGALVYSMRKAGESNETLVLRYMEEIDFAHLQLDKLQAEEDTKVTVHACPACGAEAPEGVTFCGSCGAKLS